MATWRGCVPRLGWVLRGTEGDVALTEVSLIRGVLLRVVDVLSFSGAVEVVWSLVHSLRLEILVINSKDHASSVNDIGGEAG